MSEQCSPNHEARRAATFFRDNEYIGTLSQIIDHEESASEPTIDRERVARLKALLASIRDTRLLVTSDMRDISQLTLTPEGRARLTAESNLAEWGASKPPVSIRMDVDQEWLDEHDVLVSFVRSAREIVERRARQDLMEEQWPVIGRVASWLRKRQPAR